MKPYLFYVINALIIFVGMVLILHALFYRSELDILKIGDEVPTQTFNIYHDSKYIEEEKIELAFKEDKVLLFIYSDYCSACNKIQPKWVQLSNYMPEKTFAINTAFDPSNIPTSLLFETFLIPVKQKTFMTDFKVVGVPYTLLISNSGEVLYSKIGVPELQNIKNVIADVCEKK